MTNPVVSIIIPTLNEATEIGRTLRCLKALEPPAKEVIVVDGGSTDATVAIAEAEGAQMVFTTQTGRAVQLNRGAEIASGALLCFLHADTRVPDDLATLIATTLSNPKIACGGFISLMTGPRNVRWVISLHNFVKTYYAPFLFRPHLFFGKGLRLLFGDQAMFCRHQDFWACGGFDPTQVVMEDADLCLRLVQYGRITLVNRVVQSSDRRVARWGAWKATAIFFTIGFLWQLGVPSSKLKQLYGEIR